MSVFRINIEEGKKKAERVESLEQFYSIINSEENIRNTKLAMEGNQEAKSRLVQFSYQCNPMHNNNLLAGCKEHPTTTIQIDFDFDPYSLVLDYEKENLITKAIAMKEEIGLRLVEETRKGVHIVALRCLEQSQVENLNRISKLLGVPYDENAKDLTRVFYTMDQTHIHFIDERIFELEDAPYVPDGKERKRTAKVRTAKSTPSKETALPATVTQELPDEPTPHEHIDEKGVLLYKGLRFRPQEVIDAYWKLFNNGQKPTKGNRNCLTHEVAQQLSYFTADAELLSQWIPSYDGFDKEEKLRCIASALNARPTIITRKMRAVMESLLADEPQCNRLLKGIAPLCIKVSFGACPDGFEFITIIALAPIIGTLATDVLIIYNGECYPINLFTYVVGYAASNKGSLTAIILAWMKILSDLDEANFLKEQNFKKLRRSARNQKEQPEEPELMYRTSTYNSTYAEFVHRLSTSKGKHMFCYTPESDEIVSAWSKNMHQLGVMLRGAFTNDPYSRITKTEDSVSVSIPQLKLNSTLCGTPDAMNRLFGNAVDGLVSRMAIISTPDNTFKPLKRYTPLTAEQKQTIEQVAHLLTLMKGRAYPTKLEKRALEWVEAIRLESEQMNDVVQGRARMRIHVIAHRIICALMLCRVAETLIKEHGYEGAKSLLEQNPNCWIPLMEKAQTKAMLDTYDMVADILLNEHLRYFRHRIESSYASKDYRVSPVGRRTNTLNDCIFDALPQTFTFADAFAEAKAQKGDKITRNSVSSMLGSWKEKNKIRKEGVDYVKTY